MTASDAFRAIASWATLGLVVLSSCQSALPTMTKKIVATPEAPKAIGPYSQAVEIDGWVYCSGQIALDPASGQLVGADARAQTERVLANVKAVLGAAGCTLSDVVRTTVFLANLDDFGVMNDVYGKAFTEAPPARSTIQAARLPKGALVEIDVIARKSR